MCIIYLYEELCSLTHFMTVVSFCTPLTHQGTRVMNFKFLLPRKPAQSWVKEIFQGIFLHFSYLMLCAIWYHFCNFKQCEKHPWRSVTFIKVAGDCNTPKWNTPPWVFFTFFKLYKWYQIAQTVSYIQLLFITSWVMFMSCSI